MHRLALTSIVAVALAIPASAGAQFYSAVQVDGPGAIKLVSDLDLSRDGGGAVTYIRNEGGVDHVYVARLHRGVFQPPERMDSGIEAGSSQAVVAAGEAGRFAVLFTAGGNVYANVKGGAAAPWTGPQLLGVGTDPSAGITIFGTGYAAFVQGGDVRAATMHRRSTSFSVIPGALDMDAANTAGAGTGAPQIGVSANGSALAVWGELFPDGNKHLVSRRVIDGTLSTAPRDIWLGSLEGRAGLDADLPSVAMEDDSSFAYVAFRQTFNDGGAVRQRAIARRLEGSSYNVPLTFDAGWLNGGITSPRVAIDARGEGLFTSASGASVIVSIMKDGRPRTPQALGGSGMLPNPVPTIAQDDDRVVAYMESGNVFGRYYDDQSNKRQVPAVVATAPVANATFGGVDGGGGFDADIDRLGDAAIAFVQDAGGGARRVAVAFHDLAPTRSKGLLGGKWKRSARPTLKWEPSEELWGPVTYDVKIDGRLVGKVVDVAEFTPPRKISYGGHKFQVIATDVRGQKTASLPERLGVDSARPKIDAKVTGNGRTVRVKVDARDPQQKKKPGSGISLIRVDWGDHSHSFGANASHVYKSGNRHTIKITAVDQAGNRSMTKKGAGGGGK